MSLLWVCVAAFIGAYIGNLWAYLVIRKNKRRHDMQRVDELQRHVQKWSQRGDKHE